MVWGYTRGGYVLVKEVVFWSSSLRTLASILLSSSEALLLGTMNGLDFNSVCMPQIDGEN